GPGLGEVAVADVVEFLRGVVDLVAYAAGRELARPIGLPGRRGATVEGASKVRLVGLTNGSLIAELAPAPTTEADGSMDLDVETLSEASLGAVFETVGGGGSDPDLADALIGFSERMRARRGGEPVTFIDRRGATEIITPLDDEVLARLNVLKGDSTQTPPVVDRVTGRLYQANVESDEAHVRTPSGDMVKVEFDEALEPEIKRLLGDPASIVGEIEVDARTKRVREIRARSVDSGYQLTFEDTDFWHDPDLAQLAERVDARPVDNPDALHIEASDDEWDELYRVLGRAS
ncbi:MAG TPA: hypothetical protein VM344_05230, partial [Vitreimonas sp.]|nr:hypothetical protein [Vitreimonas sp.]